jgi:hypothetical protein
MSQAEKCNCDIIIFYQLQRTRKAILLERKVARLIRCVFKESLKQIGAQLGGSFTIVQDDHGNRKSGCFLNLPVTNNQ